MWSAADEISGKDLGEGVEAVDGVRRKGGKPFEGKAFKGGREGDEFKFLPSFNI